MPAAIRFEIAATGEAGGQLKVFVDEVEMTSKAAGMGMDPLDLFLARNQLVATADARRVPIARCTCGEFGCGGTEVEIVRVGNLVRWEWHGEAPTFVGTVFDAAQYDAEVFRIAADHSWERPQDTTLRLLWEGIDHAALAEQGLRLLGAWRDGSAPEFFVASLFTNVPGFQVFTRAPWDPADPAGVARDLLDLLSRPPATWAATFMPTRLGTPDRPAMAGPAWESMAWPTGPLC